jgi:hypothetical protein
MEFMNSYIFCSPKLIDPLDEVQEIYQVIRNIPWLPDKATAMSRSGKEVAWQEAYNRLFEIEFERIGGWKLHPVLCEKLKHKGDFAKNDVFVEVRIFPQAGRNEDPAEFVNRNVMGTGHKKTFESLGKTDR